MSEPLLAVRGLTVGYPTGRGRHRAVLADLTFGLARGEFACLLGPNGVGKSTLLRTLARMQRPLAGTIMISGREIAEMGSRELARELAVVLTDRLQAGLLPVYDLVALGRYPHTGWGGRLDERDHAAVRWALTACRSEDLAARNVAELSDGERQRALIARALAQQPTVLLLDEPTAFLDLPRRVEITGLLRRLARETGLAILLSTHDLDLALRTADTIWLVTPDARLVTGAPEDLALDGSLAGTFRSAELAFDAHDGGFRLRHPPIGRARVLGEGLPACWAARTLERLGFAVVANKADGPVDLTLTAGEDLSGSLWQLDSRGASRDFRLLGDLAEHLRHHVVDTTDGRGAVGRQDDRIARVDR